MPRIRITALVVELVLDAGTIVILDGPVTDEIHNLLLDGRAELVEAPVDEREDATTP